MNAYIQPYTIPNIQVKRLEDKLFISQENTDEGDYQLFMGNKPNHDSINQFVASCKNAKFEVDLPIKRGPYYFVIKSKKSQTAIFSERVLQLHQAINVRDMGGYRTKDGRVTKWGLLFRGDQLSKLDSDDILLLEKMGIKTIIDYRSDHERKFHPNQKIPSVEKVIQCDPKSSFSEAAANVADLHEENAKLVKQLENGEIDPKYINGYGENVIEDYRQMITADNARKAYRLFLESCVNLENPPLLHHCRGGKDRTGLGSMFLLLLLGVQEEDIIRDYCLTGEIRKERNQLKYELYQELTDNEDYLAYLLAMIETRESYIKASLATIKALYDSPERYLEKHFGITQQQIAKMREFYLEEVV